MLATEQDLFEAATSPGCQQGCIHKVEELQASKQ